MLIFHTSAVREHLFWRMKPFCRCMSLLFFIHGCMSLSTHTFREDLTTSTHTSHFPSPLARKETLHHFIISKRLLHRAVRVDSVSLRLTLPQRYTFSSTHPHIHKKTGKNEEPAETYIGRAKYNERRARNSRKANTRVQSRHYGSST